MKILICGGDERFVLLAGMLMEAGHEVCCIGMEKAALPSGVRRLSAPERADAAIFPLPAEVAQGTLNAPFAAQERNASQLLSELGDTPLILGGKLSAKFREEAAGRGQRVFDYMQRPEFTAGNAAVTAEGAVSRLMEVSDKAIQDMRVLVVGWGRIGKLLLQKLRGLNAEACLMSKNPEARGLAGAMGYETLGPDCGGALMSSFDAVINTAPAQVLGELGALRQSCILLELASAPGGIDPQEARSGGMRYIAAPGLPGKYAPASAAGLIFRAAENIFKECGTDEQT